MTLDSLNSYTDRWYLFIDVCLIYTSERSLILIFDFVFFFSFLPCKYQHWDLRKKGCKIKLKHFWFLNLKSIIPSLTKERLHIWEICISISAFYNFLSICANVCSLSLSFFDTHRHDFCNVSLSCCFCR